MKDGAGKIICLTGPTGSGKTAAALHLARYLGKAGIAVVVINADSRQLYRDFPVITAQPGPEERAACPHELYGCLETEEKSSAAQWAEKAEKALRDVAGNGRLPILTGGTGLYLRALLDGMADIPPPDPGIAARLLRECRERGSGVLHARLKECDPLYAARIHPNDRQRIVRALEVWESTGHAFSWWHGRTPEPARRDVLRLGIGLPLGELAPLLGKRIRAMLKAGAMEEGLAALKRCPDLTAPGWTGIGCAEVGACLTGLTGLEECVDAWERNTRAYAKRQWTWFRADRRIRWLRPEDLPALEREAREFLDRRVSVN
jgi:tRNA dimethylallyltransferase